MIFLNMLRFNKISLVNQAKISIDFRVKFMLILKKESFLLGGEGKIKFLKIV